MLIVGHQEAVGIQSNDIISNYGADSRTRAHSTPGEVKKDAEKYQFKSTGMKGVGPARARRLFNLLILHHAPHSARVLSRSLTAAGNGGREQTTNGGNFLLIPIRIHFPLSRKYRCDDFFRLDRHKYRHFVRRRLCVALCLVAPVRRRCSPSSTPRRATCAPLIGVPDRERHVAA